MYYAKIDRFTGEVFSCLDHHNGLANDHSEAGDIRFFSENENDVCLFCQGWNSLLGSDFKFHNGKRIVLDVDEIDNKESCDELMKGWIGNNVSELIEINDDNANKMPINIWLEGIWNVVIGNYSYLINVNNAGRITDLMFCNDSIESPVTELIVKEGVL